METFDDILDRLPAYREGAREVREVLLSNLLLIGEIPAPTFGEDQRVRFICDRFAECGLMNTSTDEPGNGLGLLPGEEGERSILMVAHADTHFSAKEDHTILIQPEKITGLGVADNSMGLAVLATLPELLDKLGIRLQSDLILMAAVRSLGRGNLEGLRFFLDHNTKNITAGVCLEGVQLGRVSIGSIGMLRGEIHCSVPDEYDWTRFRASGAIATINEVVSRIRSIALPRDPRTAVILGSLEAGTSFNAVATRAVLRFEIRSESAEKVEEIRLHIVDIIEELSSKTESRVTLDVIARRQPGGIPFGHPLSRRTRQILDRLGVQHRTSPSTSELFELISKSIPGVTVGITRGERLNTPEEIVLVEPIATGLAQLAAMLVAIDKGFCDEPA